MKKLSIFLALTLLVGLLAGCTGGGAGATDAPAATTVPAATDAPATAADPAAVHPLLYRVTGPDGQEGWLFGTIHLGDERIDTALEALKPTLDGCDALAVEFDIVAYEQDFAAQMQAMSKFVLSDGTRITDHMPQETYDKAAALLKEAGVPAKSMSAYDLAMWAQLVQQAAIMTRTDFSLETGMDRTLIRYCYDKQIEVRDVESAELQYELLASFPDALNLLLIEEALDDLDSVAAETGELYDAWLNGDPDELYRVCIEGEQADAAELTETQIAMLEDYYDKMLTQRNLGMRDKALEWLRAGDKVFFAVGAAHLLGEDGLAALLQAEGYTVERMN